MAGRRIIKGVLYNFLETYTSRYSDFDGYWLFGFLVECMGDLRIDLIEEISEYNETTPITKARRLAVTIFAEQIEKVGLPKSSIREAYIDVIKPPHSVLGFVNGRLSSGYDVIFIAKAVTDLGKTYERTLCIFIAPHDPKEELRSGRASK